MNHSVSNPFPWYKKMSAENPVYYDKDYMHYFGAKGAWHVFRYHDVQTVLYDWENFSSEYAPKVDNILSAAIQVTDPPRHKQLRLLVSKAFTPNVIENMKPWIQEITKELLDKVADKGEMDVTVDLAVPVPIQVIAKMLGVPYEDRDKFKFWSTIIVKNPTEVEGGVNGYFQAQQEMAQYFMNLFEERLKDPKDDLISHLQRVDLEGEKLSEQDLLAFCITLLVAGNETTTNLISAAIYTFIENPEIQEHLYQYPEVIPTAIEEILRYRAPVQYINRIATKDVELGGQTIKKGDLINAWMGSANRDASVFENPDTFDLNRTNLKHTSFGHGIHFCLGAPLARLEAKIVLELLFSQFKQLELKDTSKELEMNEINLMFSIKSLPIVFKKR
ncbi:cytochrome P450 [Shimazuella sp. AN120528]|uniref:cytochrome P450 n=1 Tax=Shimazuella soli TaxID=1892854 RepID=UPI001F110FA5|nr:cytochrome P450 [Shimazuella soli]MCH5585282.1 cytochrome P450 [Shimazuella soli]